LEEYIYQDHHHPVIPPHLSIFSKQLEIGGVGLWLGKPDHTFSETSLTIVSMIQISFITFVLESALPALFISGKALRLRNTTGLRCCGFSCYFLSATIIRF